MRYFEDYILKTEANDIEICPRCKGKGYIFAPLHPIQKHFGEIKISGVSSILCDECKGTGEKILNFL